MMLHQPYRWSTRHCRHGHLRSVCAAAPAAGLRPAVRQLLPHPPTPQRRWRRVTLAHARPAEATGRGRRGRRDWATPPPRATRPGQRRWGGTRHRWGLARGHQRTPQHRSRRRVRARRTTVRCRRQGRGSTRCHPHRQRGWGRARGWSRPLQQLCHLFLLVEHNCNADQLQPGSPLRPRCRGSSATAGHRCCRGRTRTGRRSGRDTQCYLHTRNTSVRVIVAWGND
jgi:hypothetical protein